MRRVAPMTFYQRWRSGARWLLGLGCAGLLGGLAVLVAQAGVIPAHQQGSLYLPFVAVPNLTAANELTPLLPNTYPAQGAEPPVDLPVLSGPDCWSFVRFVNQSSASVQIYWVNTAGQELLYQELLPGQGYWQQSYFNNVWRVRSTDLRLLRQTTVDSCSQQVVAIDATLFATPAPTPVNCGKLVALRLWDVAQERVVAGYSQLAAQNTFYLQQLPPQFTLRAELDRQNRVGSVRFAVNGVNRIDNEPPYLYPENLATWEERPSGYTVTLTAYSQDGAQGAICDTRTITFVLSSAPAPTSGSIGDQVWLDIDGNALQGDNEPGVPDVHVYLLDDNGDVLAQAVTDETGSYRFGNLLPSTYHILVIPPERYVLVAQQVGENNALDSDVNPFDGMSDAIHLTMGEENLTIDAGLESLGGPLPTWVPTAAPPTFTATPTATPTPVQATPTPPTATVTPVLSPTATSTPSPMPTSTATLPPTPTSTATPPVNGIGNRVWRDDNANGLQDVGEPGLAGVTIQLEDAQDHVLKSTTTNANGNYLFTKLQPQFGYFVRVILPPGYLFSPVDVGTNDRIDSDVSPIGGFTGVIRLEAGTIIYTVDAGLVPATSTVGDRIWNDSANPNGIQDPGEPGVSGVAVNLLDASGNTVRTELSDASGVYQFANLPALTYYLCVVPPTGWQVTLANQGVDDALDSDIAHGSACTDPFTLDGGPDFTVDAGLLLP